VAPTIPARPVRRITDLQRSAFWIYGITAMVMREPFGLVVRHTTEAGLGDWQVRLELLRVAVILLLLARLFLLSGLYFEIVYMQPESADHFPRRSYPIDFLAGLQQFLVGAAATTTIGLHYRLEGQYSPFTLLVWLFLLLDIGWLAIAMLRGFSSVPLIRRQAGWNTAILLGSIVTRSMARVVDLDAVFADQLALSVTAVVCLGSILMLIHRYEAFDSV
jgi:hypothetical protein